MEESIISIMVAYEENSVPFFTTLQNLINKKYPEISLIGYREDKLKERRKAFIIKGSYAAKLNPFAVICDKDKKPLKAFYSEISECTINNIIKFIDSIVNI